MFRLTPACGVWARRFVYCSRTTLPPKSEWRCVRTAQEANSSIEFDFQFHAALDLSAMGLLVSDNFSFQRPLSSLMEDGRFAEYLVAFYGQTEGDLKIAEFVDF